MNKNVNGVVVEMTQDEITKISNEKAEQERIYWKNTSRDDLVNAEIRKRYSASQEFSILRQKDEKPDEYAAYFQYCEQCKGFVKVKMAKAFAYMKGESL